MIRKKLNCFRIIFSTLLLFCLPLVACSKNVKSNSNQFNSYENVLNVSSEFELNKIPIIKNLKTYDRSLFLNDHDLRAFSFENIIVVLGNMPLDEATPTIDTVYRVFKAIEVYNDHPNSLIIMTGGRTVGPISEAEMMGLIAWSRGVDSKKIYLEEEARTTQENAKFTAKKVGETSIDNIFIVSKKDHLPWALPYFKEFPVFKNVRGIDCGITTELIINHMEKYLELNDNVMVKKRLLNLKNGIKGID